MAATPHTDPSSDRAQNKPCAPIAKALTVAVCIGSALLSSGAFAKNCKKGIPCGNTCIAANKTCHIGAGRPSYNFSAPTTQSNTPPPKSHPSVPINSGRTVLYVAVAELSVFSEPSVSADIVRSLSFGDVVIQYERLAQWVRISPASASSAWVFYSGLTSVAP
ncbi:SH3 domain-containing protein [Sinimarinibacterium sp. CAU 1509]|nr:SH3 domain-containing protein [Sinimarinibacterium sp. CAU 1509]